MLNGIILSVSVGVKIFLYIVLYFKDLRGKGTNFSKILYFFFMMFSLKNHFNHKRRKESVKDAKRDFHPLNCFVLGYRNPAHINPSGVTNR